MPSIGPRMLLDIALPTGVDANTILNFEMREGMTPQDVITMAVTVIGEANEYVRMTYGGLYAETQRLWSRYRKGDGTRSMTPKRSEVSRKDGIRGDRIGHMLDIESFDDANDWTTDYLREAIREDLRDDVLMVRDRWINRCDYNFIWRMLSNTEVQIGQTGWAPGWAIGSGGNLPFVPPQYGAYKFDSTHTHYIRYNAAYNATNLATALDRGAQELSHHGHTGQKICLMSESNLSILKTMTAKELARFLPAGFRPAGGNTGQSTLPGELEGIPGETVAWYASDYGMVQIKYHPRLPAGYLWMGKSYGIDNPANPLALRTDPLRGGFGIVVNPQVDNSLNPRLQKLSYEGKNGVNVNDRTNGVAIQIETGSDDYESPTDTELGVETQAA